MTTKKKPQLKFWWYSELIPELQLLGVLTQVADLFANTLTPAEMARVAAWFNAKYGAKP